ncbi:MAG TPA: NADPH-dependent 7-cyano-7-deazaguanine reductase QueF [Thermoguttaceae bacterium]|nr:NADPH-dependent 7-cyano-7-deazaguanine reductase QueF [Thermoguttaceae bacterium]
MGNRRWGDCSLLRPLKNPAREKYEIRIRCPEVTFLGKRDQPDFGLLVITLYPREKIIDLRSLKQYLFSFRGELASYERLINVLYDDLMAVFEPDQLILEMRLRPRGGIASTLRVDSAWRR